MECDRHQLGDIPAAEPVHRPGTMHFHRPDAQRELMGNGFVRLALRQGLDDLELARAKLGQLDLGHQPDGLGRSRISDRLRLPLKDREELGFPERLLDEILGAEAQRPDCGVDVAVGGHDDCREVVVAGLEAGDEVQPVHSGHSKVRKEYSGGKIVRRGKKFFAGRK